MLPNKAHFIDCVKTLLKSTTKSVNSYEFSAMSAMLSQVTGISVDDDMATYHDVKTDAGIAISPVKAAKCFQEVIRTKVFLQGVNEAISQRLKAIKNDTLHVLYAGTGPYGAILLPLLPLFSGQKVTVHCIDIHRANIEALKKVIAWLEIRDLVVGVDLADAKQWRPDKGQLPLFDLIISETMNTFLQREPQVRIFAHLCQFLKREGTLIPQEIRTSVELNRVCDEKEEIYRKDLLVLNVKSCRRIARGKDEDFKHEVVLPASDKLYQHMSLNTDIQVYQSHHLGLGQSSLNLQHSRTGLAAEAGQVVKFEYKLTDSPYWEIDIPNAFESLDLCSINDQGTLGLYYLARFWDKYRRLAFEYYDTTLAKTEFELDIKLAALVGVNLQVLMAKALEFMSSFNAFEAWVDSHVGSISTDAIDRFNGECTKFQVQ
ncbi:class I SAM-dependent methyltransferase [Alteromonas sp. S015]|uniref:class I SAM-dependent methyltransferase n=1 Tax=Alteromonas sp. S015 TaxID=3117401 RepID=UPI002FE3226E